jgi:putative ubiquitin-RnfH superfamily antitoxin RatB of RatAB toxin-antitoxin module
MATRQPRSEKDYLVQRFNKLQQEVDTYENNIGFFDKSKKSEPLINQMMERINVSKQELNDLKEQIRKAEETSSKE